MGYYIPNTTRPKHQVTLGEEVLVLPPLVIRLKASDKVTPLLSKGQLISCLLLVRLFQVVGVDDFTKSDLYSMPHAQALQGHLKPPYIRH